jgi:hypothetical protein
MKPTRNAREAEDAFRDRLGRAIHNDALWRIGARACESTRLSLVPSVATSSPTRRAPRYQLVEGEVLAGTVRRMPQPDTPFGHWLVIDRPRAGAVAIQASAKSGHSVLERELARLEVRAGDEIRVTYAGVRATRDGLRSYRAYHVERIG